MLATAPRVVKPPPRHRQQQRREVRARGDREREPDHERDVLALEHEAEHDREDARARPSRSARRAAARAPRPCPCLTTWPHRSCASAAAPESVRPATTARIVANATAEMKPRKPVPPSTSASSGAAMLPPLSTRDDRLAADEHRRAEAEDERDEVEEADQRRRVGDRAARGLRVGHRVEPHEDVRQPGGAEHQRDAERDRLERVRDELAGREHRGAVLRARLGEQRSGLMPNFASTSIASSVAPSSSSTGLDDLHPGRRDHPAEQHVERASRRRRSRSRARTTGRTSGGRGCRRRPSARSDRTRRR